LALASLSPRISWLSRKVEIYMIFMSLIFLRLHLL
jgi:hypothetical protein